MHIKIVDWKVSFVSSKMALNFLYVPKINQMGEASEFVLFSPKIKTVCTSFTVWKENKFRGH